MHEIRLVQAGLPGPCLGELTRNVEALTPLV